MKKFRTGNVIKNKHGHIQIVVESPKENYLNTISFDSSNSSSGYAYEDREYSARCYCNNDTNCECKGTGETIKIIYGYKHAEFLADSVKDYILSCLLKNFDF